MPQKYFFSSFYPDLSESRWQQQLDRNRLLEEANGNMQKVLTIFLWFCITPAVFVLQQYLPATTLNQTTLCLSPHRIIWSNYFCIEVRVQARIYVSRLGIYNYCLRFYSIFAFFFFKEWIVSVMMQRGGCSCSLLRNENAEDFRHY